MMDPSLFGSADTPATATLFGSKKPIVALKVGKTGSGARAALTHTASLVGDYDVCRAAFRQSGVVEAQTFQELVDFGISLSMLPPSGNRLAIVTNAGGVGAIAADEAQRLGLLVEPLAQGAGKRLLSEFAESGFVSNASLGNPIDLTATVGTSDFVKAVEEVVSLPQYDLVLVLPTHQAPAIEPDISAKLVEVARRAKKPVCMCVVGRAELASELQRAFMQGGVPSFPTPERAVAALASLWRYSSLKKRVERPPRARTSGRRSPWKSGQLAYEELSELLGAYGLQEPKSVALRSPKDLEVLAKVKYPVACKLLSKALPHKTDVGGVALDVKNAGDARRCFVRFRAVAGRAGAKFEGMLVQEMVGKGVELILGARRDPTFGPTVAFGPGGTYVELSREIHLAVAPISSTGVLSMLEGTSLEKLLRGYRGGPRVSVERLCDTVARFSRIILENPSIQEIEVNPLIAMKDATLAVDARALASR